MKIPSWTAIFSIGAAALICGCVQSAPSVSAENNANNSNTNNSSPNNSNNTGSNNTNNSNTNNSSTNNVTSSNNTIEPTTSWHHETSHSRVEFELKPSGFVGTLAPFTAMVRLDIGPFAREITPATARFVTASGDTVPHEIAAWEGGIATLWLRLPSISPGLTHRIWLYWGGQDSEVDPASVWADLNFHSVYHFDGPELALNSVDGSTELACDGCSAGDGAVAMGLEASGEGLVGSLPPELLPGPSESVTVSAWYIPTNEENPIHGPLVYAESYCVGWQLALVESTGEIYASHSADSSVDPAIPDSYCQFNGPRPAAVRGMPTDQRARHVVAIFNRTTDESLLFVDGEFKSRAFMGVGAIENDVSGFEPRLRIGTQESANADSFLENGNIDEVFIMTDSVDANWIAAHYANVEEWADVATSTPVETRP